MFSPMIFNNDERIVINGIVGTEIKTYSRERFLNELGFQREISGDDMITEMLTDLYNKCEILTDDDWDEILLQMPLEVWADPNDTFADGNIPDDEYEY